jgi:23S rRNA (guanosine2251-2'-O)-methyltransferase
MYVYGIHTVTSFLREGRVTCLHAIDHARNPRLQHLLEEAARYGVRVYLHPKKTLDVLVDVEHHQGIVAEVEEAIDIAERSFLELIHRDAIFLVLDQVQDPRNLGACLRTAEAFGVSAVIVPRHRSAPLTPAAQKAASGALPHLHYFEVANIAQALRAFKQRSVWVYGADASARTTIDQTALAGPIAWVMGGEGKGLRRLTKTLCDSLYAIPMKGKVESLNVSVATGIVLYETLRQKRALGP